MIIAFGDSIAFGQFLKPPDKAWPRLISGDVSAFGVPGDTTRLGLERFPAQVQALRPEKVVIQFGHNDANRWDTDGGLPRVSPAAFTANLAEMVDRARQFGARPYLCTLTPSFRSARHTVDCAEYNHLLREVAIGKSVDLIDVRHAFDELGVHNTDLLMPDGLHLTARGHEIYADMVEHALR